MPRREAVDIRTRLRIAAHLRNKMREMGLTQTAAGKLLGVRQPTISKILHGGAVGLDVFILLHRRLHIDANAMLDIEPRIKP